MRGLSTTLLCGVAVGAGAGGTGQHCGPTAQEVGRNVLVATPFVFGLGALVLVLFLLLWRALEPAVWRPRVEPLLILGAVVTFPAALVLNSENATRYFWEALWLYGCSFATVLLVSARLFIATAPRRAAFYAMLPPVIVNVPIAALLALDVGTHGWFADRAENYFVTPGYGGWIPGGLALLLLVEIAVRYRLRRRALRAPLA
jgi:hypothetical protein